jgi:hypothetical protein
MKEPARHLGSESIRNQRLERLKEICKTFSPESYRLIDNNRLAVYVIALLIENNLQATQESITVALYLMFPEKFSLVGFSEYPDGERVTRTLLQLGKKYRNWAIGNRHVGYSLNDTGKLVFEQTKKLLHSPDITEVRKKTPKQRTIDPDVVVKEIEQSALFRAYKSDAQNCPDEFSIWELLRALPYTPKGALIERLRNMTESAKASGRDDIVDFLEWVKARFSNVFLEEGRKE